MEINFTPKEAKVIMLRNGIYTPERTKYTLEMVAKELGVTRERIRQIEAKAYDKLNSLSKQI